jgi:hypothetical protein
LQKSVPLHVPHVATPLHWSLIVPHWPPWSAHDLGEQLAAPQTFAEPPPPHVRPDPQSPQWMVPPQPSGMSPQFFPAGQAFRGVHCVNPHVLATPPPPHVPVVQAGHVSTFPQPSPVCPHSMPCCSQLSALQLTVPHLYAAPPPPHVPEVQGPHVTVPPQPSGSVPHSAPRAAHVFGVQTPLEPHWFGTPAPPQVWPVGHVAQVDVRPPQPSLCCPHVPLG